MLFFLLAGSGTVSYAQTDIAADEALAPVKINGKWGYIDKLGKLVIPARYNNAGVFTEGCAPVQISDFWGYIDKTGNWFLRPVFTQASNFSNRRAQISLFDPTDSTTVTGYITPQGEFLFKIEAYEVGYDYHDKLLRVRSADNSGMAFGFRDSTGAYIIQPRFDGAMDFSEGLAAMMLGKKWGFTSPANDFAIFPEYEEAYSFTDGHAFVRTGKKKGFINKAGKMVINLSAYEEVSPFIYEEMIAVRKNGKMGFVDKKGKLKIKAVYDNPLLGSFNEGLAAVAVKSTDGAIKWGYIDKSGKMVIAPAFDEASSFFQDRARIKVNGKYGFIDITGKMIAEPTYDDAYNFSPTYK
ncbi:MAG: WG repeat-containing protein [Bacteroidia bacterium]